MSFQHSPYLTPSASGGPHVLTWSQRRRQQEAEGPPPLHEVFLSNPTTSVGNEGSSAVFEEVCHYLYIRELVLKGLHAANHSPWKLTLKTIVPSNSNLPLLLVLEKPQGKDVPLPTRSVDMQLHVLLMHKNSTRCQAISNLFRQYSATHKTHIWTAFLAQRKLMSMR